MGAKKTASKPVSPPAPPGVHLSADEVRALRRLLEGVMTLASHGILFRFGQTLAESVIEEARKEGGALEQAATAVLARRGWIAGAQMFPQKVQVFGSLEVDAAASGGEPTCHILRGLLQRVLETSRGPLSVRELECQSTGSSSCVFEVARGGRGG